jgi:CheY-like chemotaxis protein
MEKKGVLLVDDEAMALKYFSRAFGNRFTVYSAASAREALEILDSHRDEIGVIVTDQRMPESSGVELLKIVRTRFPQTVRILTTAYSELDTLVEAINTGAVYSFVTKPWEIENLERTVAGALDLHQTQIQNAELLEAKVQELKARLLVDRAYDVGQISAKIGHYVHNALCPLTFLIDQLLDRTQTGDAYSIEFLQSVRDHIYDVARTLKDLEQASVPPARTECRTLNLEAMFDQALARTEIIRTQKRLRIEKTASTAIPTIKGSPEQIEKLFRFMIAEEIVSLPPDSLVRVQFGAHEADGETLGVKIEVEDFVPVSPQVCPESLLHPFNLRGSNPREFGIFLVSCYFIVRHHGGSLTARIKDDNGLSFSFFLPCEPPETLVPDSMSLKSLRLAARRPSKR